MQERDIYSKLTRVFRETFDDQSIVLTSQTTAHDIAGWDSTAHINLIVAIEDEFHIELQTAEIEPLKDVGEMAFLLSKKLARNPSKLSRSYSYHC